MLNLTFEQPNNTVLVTSQDFNDRKTYHRCADFWRHDTGLSGGWESFFSRHNRIRGFDAGFQSIAKRHSNVALPPLNSNVALENFSGVAYSHVVTETAGRSIFPPYQCWAYRDAYCNRGLSTGRQTAFGKSPFRCMLDTCCSISDTFTFEISTK